MILDFEIKFWPGEAGRDVGSLGPKGTAVRGAQSGSPLGPKTPSGLSAKRAPSIIMPSARLGALIAGRGTERRHYAGCIHLPELCTHLELVPRVRSANPNHPTHDVYAQLPSGDWLRIGAGWQRLVTRGERTGELMMSLTLDAPDRPRGINVAALLDAGGPDLAIVRRSRKHGAHKSVSA